MAKTKHPDNESRPGLDYYEYKKMQETARLRRRALEANLYEARRKSEPSHKSKMRVVAKIADEDPAKNSASEDLPREHATASTQPEASAGDSAEEAQLIYQDPDSMNARDNKGYDENDVEITNPFADALGKIRLITGRLLKRRAREESEDEVIEYDDQDEGSSQGAVSQETMRTKAARLKKAGRPGVTLALSEDDDDGDLDRRSLRKAAQAVHAVANDVDDDPLGVMRPYSEEERRAYMRPSAGDDELHRSVTRASKQQQRIKEAAAQSEANLTAKLLDDLENIPALSRRERKALASAGTLSKAATRRSAISEGETPVDDEHIDEPTQQFRPLRYRAAKPAAREVREVREARREAERIPPARIPAPIDDDDDDYLDDEDEDDEDDYVRQAPPRRFGRKRRVYRDEEYDSDEDDEDDYDEDDYDSDYDEDDEDYDDYDEEEALNDRYQVSFGKRALALIKGLLIVVVLFLLAIVTLRQLETSGKLSLDFIRNTVGQMLPIELLLPSPAASGNQIIDVDETPLPTDLPTPEPAFAPDDSEGSPLDDYSDDGEMQGMDSYDELDGYSDFGDSDFGDDGGGDEDPPEDLDSDDAQARASFARFTV